MKKRQPARSRGSSARFSMKELFLQPWFLDKKCASAIRRMVPQVLVHKMRLYFEDWGCLVCRSKKRRYGSNGMCHICTARIQKRLYWCLRKRALTTTVADPQPEHAQDIDRVRIARTLLSDLVNGEWSPNRLRLRTRVGRVNSVNSPTSPR